MSSASGATPEYDVVVAGGGPAGSATAALVALDGHRVAVVERQRFPRYQVGESLWVATWDIFDALGVSDRLRAAGFVEKRGGTFRWGPVDRPWSIYFAEPDGSVSTAFQVDRARFDDILLDHARALGADLIHGTATRVERDAGRVCGLSVSIDGASRLVGSRFVVDASGLNTKLTPPSIEVSRPGGFTSASVWSYFRGVAPLEPPKDGNVLTVAFAHGWFWVIPISRDLTSVGAVVDPSRLRRDASVEGHGPEGAFHEALEACSAVRDMLREAGRSEPFRTRVFAPRNLSRYGEAGFLSVGDAACFIDPVFSTGVHLGMSGACFAAYAVNTVLRGGDEGRAVEAFDRYYRTDYDALQAMTEELFALNAHLPDRFWQARQTPLSAARRRRVADTAGFLARIGGLDGDLQASVAEQLAQARHTHAVHGTGRYRDPGFLADRLRFDTAAAMTDGYAMGEPGDWSFTPATVVAARTGMRKEVSPADLALFELCDGTRSVGGIIEALRGRFDFTDLDTPDLAEKIGTWLEAGVLARTA